MRNGKPGDQMLRRSLSMPMLLFYGVGVIIGAGIYSVLGAAAGVAGYAVWLSLALAAVPAALTALCYAELGTRFPRAGGGFVFVREALPRWPSVSFAVGILTLATAAATVATVATAFGGYLAVFLGDSWPLWGGAVALIAACTFINIAGIRESTWVTVGCTVVEVIGLVLIIGAGVGTGRFGERALEIDFPAVMVGAALAFFVFTGFEGLVNLAEETKEPRKALPAAVLVSLAVTLVLYILTALGAVALLSPRELAASDSPLAAAAGVSSAALATAMAWIALVSTANTGLITLVVASRLMYGMAKSGSLPAAAGWTLTRRRSPWVAALVLGGTGAAMLPLGGVAVLGSVASLTTLMIFAAVCAALALIRRAERAGASGFAEGEGGDAEGGGFRVPGEVGGVPVVSVLAIGSIIALATQFQGVVYAIGGGTLVLAVVAGAARNRWSGADRESQVQLGQEAA